MYVLIVVAIVAGLGSLWLVPRSAVAPTPTPVPEDTMCTMDAMQCPDGSYVGRSGQNCEVVCPPLPTVPADVQTAIDKKADLIKITSPVPLGLIENGVVIKGTARGFWYFEASFPIVLTNWDGLIIAQGIATADGEWMTSEFVPFTATLEFTSPYTAGMAETMKNGTLILKKDNPSGLPEHDDALEIPVRFAP